VQNRTERKLAQRLRRFDLLLLDDFDHLAFTPNLRSKLTPVLGQLVQDGTRIAIATTRRIGGWNQPASHARDMKYLPIVLHRLRKTLGGESFEQMQRDSRLSCPNPWFDFSPITSAEMFVPSSACSIPLSSSEA
jgi:hypothetical protein